MHYVAVVAEHAPDVAYKELETITAGLSDPDPDVRTYAFTALGWSGPTSPRVYSATCSSS
jgi:hypothetical protein